VAQNATGSVTTNAQSPSSAAASAKTTAAVGAAFASLAGIAAGQAVSDATVTPGGPPIGVGAMSAGYGGAGGTLRYAAAADFDFKIGAPERLFVGLLDNDFTGNGFDSLTFQISVDGNVDFAFSATSLANAEAFFSMNPLLVGWLGTGSQTVDVLFSLTASAIDDGFGFDYALAPSAQAALGGALAAPEPSTWVEMLTGFVGLGFARRRVFRRTTVASPRRLPG
jgi:hypothetical protein